MKMRRWISYFALTASVTILLVACGDGGAVDTTEGPATTTADDSASTTAPDESATTTVADETTTTGPPAELETVRFTIFPGAIPSMGVYIADTMGFFADQGLEIEYVTVGTGSSAMQVLVAGETDFTISDLTGVATARSAGADVVFVSAQFHRFMAAMACQPDLDIPTTYPESMLAMEGRTIGITAPGSSTDTYTQFSMIAAGADPDNAEIIPLGGVPQLIAAFQAQSVDCLVAYQPMQFLLEDYQSAVDWEAGEGPEAFDTYLFNGIVTTETFDADNPEAVAGVAAAMRQAVELASDPSNAEEIAAATSQFFEGLDEETLAQVIADGAGTYGYEITEAHISSASEVYEAVTGEDLGVSYSDVLAPSLSG